MHCRVEKDCAPGGGYVATVAMHRERQTPGDHAARIRVYVNGATEPDMALPVYYVVMPPVEAHPASVIFGQIRAGAAAERTIELRSNVPYKVVSARSTCAAVTLSADATHPSTYHLRCMPATDAQGSIEGSAVFEFSSPQAFRIEVPLAAEIGRSR